MAHDEVRLHGSMAEQFGSEFRLALDTPNVNEAIRALGRQIKGFRSYIARAHEDNVAFRLLIGGKDVTHAGGFLSDAVLGREEDDEERFHEDYCALAADLETHASPGEAIEIVPVPVAAGKVGQIIGLVVGVALLAVATWGLGLLAAGPGLASGATVTFTTVGGIGFTTGTLGLVGIGLTGALLVASSVISLTSPGVSLQSVTKDDQSAAEEPEEVVSFNLSGPRNTRGAGRVVKVWYGEGTVGTHMISVRVFT